MSIPLDAKQHPVYKHLYVTNVGEVWSTLSNKILKGDTVYIVDEKKYKQLGRIVYETIKNCNLGANEVIHKDGNSKNNHIDNLHIREIIKCNFEIQNGKYINPETGNPFYNNEMYKGKIVQFRETTKDGIKKLAFCDEQKLKQLKEDTYKKRKIEIVGEHRTPEKLTSMLISGAKRRANEKNADCNLDHENILTRIINMKDEITGVPFILASKGNNSRNPNSPSIDRVDSSNNNYTTRTVQVVTTQLNLLRNNFEDKDTHTTVLAFARVIENPHLRGTTPPPKRARSNSWHLGQIYDVNHSRKRLYE